MVRVIGLHSSACYDSTQRLNHNTLPLQEKLHSVTSPLARAEPTAAHVMTVPKGQIITFPTSGENASYLSNANNSE
ncbi:9515_t:CDS:2 [Ambispora gerdemannii]|uniref:9515_t:CDS:1 n=1 Tax=Ambispora gerdemannii TaxID=144530 RepID=A0A9N9H612_9GLOM|nr:9515_t:CDS:2 [Ambispora gerdemannii]